MAKKGLNETLLMCVIVKQCIMVQTRFYRFHRNPEVDRKIIRAPQKCPARNYVQAIFVSLFLDCMRVACAHIGILSSIFCVILFGMLQNKKEDFPF